MTVAASSRPSEKGLASEGRGTSSSLPAIFSSSSLPSLSSQSGALMSTLLSPNFLLEDVAQEDLIIASLAWGFTLGFGWLTTWTAIKQTTNIWRRYSTQSIHNTYIWLIWLEIIVCLSFGIICWLYLLGHIHPR